MFASVFLSIEVIVIGRGLDGEEEGFEPDYDDAGKVADEGEPGDATKIPHEGYLFNSHCYNTGC